MTKPKPKKLLPPPGLYVNDLKEVPAAVKTDKKKCAYVKNRIMICLDDEYVDFLENEAIETGLKVSSLAASYVVQKIREIRKQR